jgi:predicted GNAT superfamily acetyltransferase
MVELALCSKTMTRAPARLSVSVRDVRGADELRACQDLQRKAWGITEDGYVVPVATMASVQKVGGLVLGAFDESNQMLVGFAFGFLGRLNDRLVLWSQLTGVHPAHQSSGVGRQLKLEQRKRANQMGLAAVAWAFDPLQASNAAFNLGVLGAIARTYELDMYGSRTDALNVGMATDRLIAEWETTGNVGGRTNAAPDAAELIETANGATRAKEIPAGVESLTIEVPARISDLKARGTTAAVEWQQAVRQAFQLAFAAGYRAVGFSREDPARPRYLLERTA